MRRELVIPATVLAGVALAATGWALGPRPAPRAAGQAGAAEEGAPVGAPPARPAHPAAGAPGTDTPRPADPNAAAQLTKQRGVTLGLFAEDVSFSYAPLLAEIVALGATHVALVIPLYQSDGASHDIGLDTRQSPTLGVVAETIRAARRDGLEVTLLPILRLRSPRPGEWRGTLVPADRDAWFRRYAEALGDLAALASSAGAERLVVGSELSTLDGAGDLDRWRPLVERVRAVFAGKLVYSANWDHYREASVFDLVDEEGVSGYFNLRDAGAPADDATLEAGWRRARGELEAWRAGRSAAFVFTELGYRSRAGSSGAPWDETAGGTPDLDEQRRAFAAFRRVWAGATALAGVYVWNWYGYGGPGTTSYTPRGKPAELEVRALLKDL